MAQPTRFDLPGFGGKLIHPGDADYDDARSVYNRMIDRKPALIARCNSADDVVLAVNLAREQNLPLSVYGGGHGVTGAAVVDAGIVVDMRGMKGADVDPKAKTIRAEAGLTWGEFDAATQEHGLVYGWPRDDDRYRRPLAGQRQRLARAQVRFRATTSSRAEVVTADGRKVKASEQENADLFWGLRGGAATSGSSPRPSPAVRARPDRVRRHARVAGLHGHRRAAATATS
jgi:FAD/FMN-containing dehydrogenase